MITTEMPFGCPKCAGNALKVQAQVSHGAAIESGTLQCLRCSTIYPIAAGVPDMVPQEVLSSDDWQLWNDHLAGFAARRRERLKAPDSFTTRITNQSGTMQRAFAAFTRIEQGPVLDIGCGPGGFRLALPEGIEYFGIDPLPLEAVSEFPFARAVAEYLPFPDNTFRHVVVMAAMDHFRDVPAFCRETLRVLVPEGKLHVVQSIHEVRGVKTAVKVAAHWVKDTMESRATKSDSKGAPKHMSEYDRRSIRTTMEEFFQFENEQTFSKRWYSPENLFLTMAPRPNPG